MLVSELRNIKVYQVFLSGIKEHNLKQITIKLKIVLTNKEIQ